MRGPSQKEIGIRRGVKSENSKKKRGRIQKDRMRGGNRGRKISSLDFWRWKVKVKNRIKKKGKEKKVLEVVRGKVKR